MGKKKYTLEILLIFLIASPSQLYAADATSKDMARIKGGTFWMGSDNGNTNERPPHQVTVDNFWIDKYPVTNKVFDAFVKAAGYVTYAEKIPDPKDFPTIPKELLVPGSIVFKEPKNKTSLNDYTQWWAFVEGADWRHPRGPDSNLKGLDNHPVVHVAYPDAEAYCHWKGGEIPTEAQFEYAARGGLDRKPYIWGDQPKHLTKKMANLWEGNFPTENKQKDGYYYTSPVGTYPPNGYGLYDMAGNVWEWVSDWYNPDYFSSSPQNNPRGVQKKESFDPNEPGTPKRITKGGSYLCNDVYCRGYRPSARMPSDPNTSLGHTGFRCVINP